MSEPVVTAVVNPGTLPVSVRLRGVLLACTLVGIVTFAIALKVDTQRAWYNFLQEHYFFLCLGLAGVFFVALQHATNSTWSVSLRRIPEGLAAYLPVALLLQIGVIIGAKYLYAWVTPEFTEAHPLHYAGQPPPGGRLAYLNLPFFSIRTFAFLGVWILFGWLLVRNSIQQEETRDPLLSRKNVKLSIAFLPVFALTFTLAVVDLLMSLEPRWYSTIFGVYCFSGLFQGGLAFIIILVILLRRQGALAGVTNPAHLKDLGTLLFAFSVFMCYIGFSQFMLIWYANMPEETFYIMKRLASGWLPVTVALPLLKFFFPFFVIMSQNAKKNEKVMLVTAIVVLVGQWLDVYWMVAPAFRQGPPLFGWIEAGIAIGFLGLFGLCLVTFFRRFSLVPAGDPRLLESVHLHH